MLPGMDPTAGLRVALIAPPYYDVPPAAYGGIESVVADLADALVDRGHSITIIGAGDQSTRSQFVKVWDRTIEERLGEPFPEVMHALLARQAVERLVDTIDVVHDHSYSGPLNSATYASWGLPTVVTMHGPASDPDLRHFFGTLGKSVHMVAISERQRVLAPELNWVGTVPNALDISSWPYREDKRPYGLFLGRFCADKGVHHALDAAHEAGMPVVLAGKCSEPSEKAYFAAEVEPRIQPTDVLFGEADAREKRILLAGARCLLFPIQWEEPFGMVMIEAMACGTPVVALRGGSVPEVVIDGVTGIICDHPDQLVQAIQDVELIDSAKCRDHVATKFNAAELARGYEEAYLRAIESVTRTRPSRRVQRRIKTGGQRVN